MAKPHELDGNHRDSAGTRGKPSWYQPWPSPRGTWKEGWAGVGSPEGSTENWTKTRPAQGTCRVEARRIKTVLPLCSPAQAPGDSARNNSKGNGAVGGVPAGRTQMERRRKSGQRVAGTVWFPVAAITRYHRLGGLKHGHLFSHGSGGQKSKIKVSAGLCSLWRN